jgi:hypothetical protein
MRLRGAKTQGKEQGTMKKTPETTLFTRGPLPYNAYLFFNNRTRTPFLYVFDARIDYDTAQAEFDRIYWTRDMGFHGPAGVVWTNEYYRNAVVLAWCPVVGKWYDQRAMTVQRAKSIVAAIQKKERTKDNEI